MNLRRDRWAASRLLLPQGLGIISSIPGRGADSVAAFFARLGYNTDVRTAQTAGNLGITAEGTTRQIKRIELLASQESLLQVYLFEVTSVTVAITRTLARAFRNLQGNYLLVVTNDYQRLDFVLVDKAVPKHSGNGRNIAQAQISVRPRTLTVDRRKPGTVDLRVLRRFTYTESDPLGQYEKLKSAYTIADWSEELFNNRALFSDHFLLTRLRSEFPRLRDEFPEWREDPKPAYRLVQDLYRGARGRYGNLERKDLTTQLYEPLFRELGFVTKAVRKASEVSASEPDFRLQDPESGRTLALCLAYPWGRSLDSKDDQRDAVRPDENPGAHVVSLLQNGEAGWAVVTNGKTWRMYSAATHSRATNYYEIDLEEALAAEHQRPGDAFRYFWLLFRREAFQPQVVQREGKSTLLCFLDRLLAGSQDYAKELGERLKERIFVKVFPHLAEGFITSIRAQEGAEADLSQPRLDEIYRGTLTLLYRLLFLFYAESRDLLPVKETRGYFEVSLTKLKYEIKEAVGEIEDEVPDRIKRRFRGDSYQFWDRLTQLCVFIDRGNSDLNVPFYNGGLFMTEPDPEDSTPEATNARFLKGHRVPDRHLASALDLLARLPDSKRQDLVFLDYKSLGVRHLGSIYEGLLEFKLRIAGRKLGALKQKNREVYKPFSELNDRQKRRAERDGKVVSQSKPYLENDKHERRSTGSYYTPDHIVEYIVKNTVGPVLDEHFEKLRAKLRQAQADRRAFQKRQAELERRGLKPEPESKADLIGRVLVDDLFDVKVLDPAMGSGHFLVETVDYITDRILELLSAFPRNPVLPGRDG